MSRILTVELNEKDFVDATLRLESGAKVPVAANLPDAKIQQWYQKLVNISEAELLPPAVRYISPEKNLLIWERPPGYITVNYSPAKQNRLQTNKNSEWTFRIPVPWQVYVIGYNSQYVTHTVYMYFRTAPLANGSTDVCYPPLPNFYADGKLCQAVYENIPEATNLFQMLNNVYEMIWNSGFNDDLYDSYNYACKLGLDLDKNHPIFGQQQRMQDTLKKWAKLSVETILTVSWARYSNDVFQVVNSERKNKTKNIEATQFVMDLQSIY